MASCIVVGCADCDSSVFGCSDIWKRSVSKEFRCPLSINRNPREHAVVCIYRWCKKTGCGCTCDFSRLCTIPCSLTRNVRDLTSCTRRIAMPGVCPEWVLDMSHTILK
ncbi:unnamed protein product, partial [Dicrocoelium dendriticum]